MSWLLNVGYVLLLIAATPWLAWAAWRQGKYRQGWSAKLWGRVPPRRGDRPCIWWHAVSVGEVNLLPSMLTPLLQQCDVECVITTTTPHRLRTGTAQVPAAPGRLLPARLQLGRPQRPASPASRPAGADRAGAVAQPDSAG